MTQRLQAEHLLSLIRMPDDHVVEALGEVLAAAQNAPPQGAADGSINEAAWCALADCVNALNALKKSAKTFRESLS